MAEHGIGGLILPWSFQPQTNASKGSLWLCLAKHPLLRCLHLLLFRYKGEREGTQSTPVLAYAAPKQITMVARVGTSTSLTDKLHGELLTSTRLSPIYRNLANSNPIQMVTPDSISIMFLPTPWDSGFSSLSPYSLFPK